MVGTLALIAIQHELGMAIGLDIRLKPMLRAFASVCLNRLGLAGMCVHLYREPVREGGENIQHPRHLDDVFSIPEMRASELEDLQRLYTRLLQQQVDLQQPLQLQQQFQPLIEHYCEQHKEYFYLYPLDVIGFITLRRKHKPLSPVYLELLVPIFKRLAISCQASLEHEQLLITIEACKTAESRIVFQLHHDDLTLLPNRRALMEMLQRELDDSENQGLQGALLFIDLDRFKAINDTLGHLVGDELLKAVAQALRNTIRSEDIVARLGGDEFVVVLSKIKAGEDELQRVVAIVLEKIRDVFARSIQTGEHLLHVSPSIGVALFPEHGINAERLLRNADTAMYIAKSQGQNTAVFYEDRMSADLDIRLQVEKELQMAIKTCADFRMVYQPQYDHNGQIIGAEALIRWKDRNGKEVSPAHFIPVAEETGLMIELGQWIMREACTHIHTLQKLQLPPSFKKVSVNVSAIQFNQPNYVQELLKIITNAAITAQMLGIELTESALITNINTTRDNIAALQAQGIDVSIDDFGTGYSSLSYLNRFPIKTLKIDQAFVRNANRDASNRAIVETIIALANSLGLNVIAEGVETFEEFDCLNKLNCYQYQGYYFSRPLEFTSLCALMLNNSHDQSDKIKPVSLSRRHTDPSN